MWLVVPSSLEIFCDTGGGREIKMEGEKENIGKPDPSKRPRPITPKIFKKCKSATFTLDGTSYTIGKCLYRCDWSERLEFPFVGSLIPRSGVYQQRESHFVNHHLSGSFTRIICGVEWTILVRSFGNQYEEIPCYSALNWGVRFSFSYELTLLKNFRDLYIPLKYIWPLPWSPP